MRCKPAFLVLISSVLLLSCGEKKISAAESLSNNYQSDGHIRFSGEIPHKIIDPENPDQEVNPGESAHTEGPLRIDFVPDFQFGSGHEIKKGTIFYPVYAQQFHGETKPRGNFVQVTDQREGAKGWTLQLKQEYQFTSEKDRTKQLKGSVLSLDKSWVQTDMPAFKGPEVSKDVIHIDNIGQSYNLANAKVGTGYGRWTISFGMSDDNPMGEKGTLKPKADEHGALLLDPAYENKPVYENSAIKLAVPGNAKKEPGTYNTVLTWILAELP